MPTSSKHLRTGWWRAAGMIPVGVTWGFRGAGELREAGAAHLIDPPASAARFAGAGPYPRSTPA